MRNHVKRNVWRGFVIQRGYTVLELIAVVSLLSVLATLSVSGIRRALDREEVDGWVRSVAYDIAAGQQAAITRRTTVTATFQNQMYSVAVVGGGVLRADTLPSHITLGNTVQSLSFDRRGTPTNGGSALTAPFMLRVRSTTTGRQYDITVEPATGRVTYSEL